MHSKLQVSLHNRLIWRADTNKAHRCPCWVFSTGDPLACNGYVSTEETDWTFKRLHVYRCGKCGIKVTRFPGWPHYPGTERYWSRFTWTWGRGLRYKVDNLWHHATWRLWYGRRPPKDVDIYVTRTPWRQRLFLNTWHLPYPYLFHRWDVMASSEGPGEWGIDGWLGGFWRRSSAEAYLAECLKENEEVHK